MLNEVRTDKTEFKFHRYAQSERCKRMDDSSVSYAAGTLISLWKKFTAENVTVLQKAVIIRSVSVFKLYDNFVKKSEEDRYYDVIECDFKCHALLLMHCKKIFNIGNYIDQIFRFSSLYLASFYLIFFICS